MNLGALVDTALGQGRDLVSQTGVVYRRVTSADYNEVEGRFATPGKSDVACPKAVVLPFGGASSDRLVDRSKLKDHTRRVLLSRTDLGAIELSPDDLVVYDGHEWGIVTLSEIGGLVTTVVTR